MSHQDTQKCYIIIEILYYLCHTEIHSAVQCVISHQGIEAGQWSYHDIEQNKANRQTANVGAIKSKEEQSALSGPAGTMLTGSGGVDNSQYNLGGNTLLGG